MRIYNTLTRQVEDFAPLKPPITSIYTCGPTVYDYYHIGNLRNAVFNDTLRRTLEILGYRVKHVMNITDVGHLVSDADEGEDKLEKGAKREGKTVWEVAQHYTDTFKKDMAALNVIEPNAYKSKKYKDSYARATEFIDEQIKMVKILLDKGFAYQTEQAIYFEVSKLPNYGILTGQRLADKEVAARKEVVTDESKRSPHDFAVWFFTVGHFKEHNMHWPSPWGDGFPGWHLECSAIIHTLLGDPIDIHTGGIDHIGTHHPNEMAQTEACFGHQLSKFWVHNEFVLVNGHKMAKSKQNAYTLADIQKHGFSPLEYRLLALQAHYRTELNFSWDNLTAAKNRLQNLHDFADLKHQTSESFKPLPHGYFDELGQEIKKVMADDLKTPDALRILSESIDYIDNCTGGGLNPVDASAFSDFLEFLDRLLGLNLADRADITKAQRDLLQQRQEARNNKDWPTSDKLRKQIKEQDLAIRDTAGGQLWSRT